MSTTTPTLSLVKPATGDAPSTLRTAISTNADALDTAVLTGDARLLSAALQAALAGTSGTPGSGNKFVTAADIGVGVQAHDSDLDAIAALATTSIGRSLLAAADAAALRTILALGTAATSATSAFDAAGAAAAAQAASQPLDSDLTAIAALATTSLGRSLLTVADAIALQRAAPLAVVSSLPASPVDGQECYYLADSTNGVIWHLKYRSASGSSYKWEYVGGAALWATDMSDRLFTIANPSWTASPNTLSITVPLAGDYDFHHESMLWETSAFGTGLEVGLSVGGATPTDPILWQFQAATNAYDRVFGRKRITALSASAVVSQQFSASTGTVSMAASRRTMGCTPVRVG